MDKNRRIIGSAIEMLKILTEEERTDVFSEFCVYCGKYTGHNIFHCMNDE